MDPAKRIQYSTANKVPKANIVLYDENNQPINRINDIGSRIVKSSTGNLIEYTHSKFSIESKNKIRKKIKIFINNKNYNNNKESNLITNNNNEIDKSEKNDLDYYREVSDKNSKNGENEEEEKRRKIFGSTNNKQDFYFILKHIATTFSDIIDNKAVDIEGETFDFCSSISKK